MTEPHEPETDLEEALIHVLPRRSTQGGWERAFWRRPGTVAETFQYVFDLVRKTLGVREEDLELGSAHYGQNQHGVALYYYHSDMFLDATCSQGGKELELRQYSWASRWSGGLGYVASKKLQAERPESRFTISAGRGGWRLRLEDCEAIRAVFEEACRVVGSEKEGA